MKKIISKIPDIKEIKELKLEILVKMSDLAVAGFGLVAALAWNEAIQSLVNKILPKDSNGGIIAKLFYAIIITSIVVLITVKLGKATNKAKEELKKTKEK